MLILTDIGNSFTAGADLKCSLAKEAGIQDGTSTLATITLFDVKQIDKRQRPTVSSDHLIPTV